jgi:hypothetical protein
LRKSRPSKLPGPITSPNDLPGAFELIFLIETVTPYIHWEAAGTFHARDKTLNRHLGISTGICVALVLTGTANQWTQSAAAQETKTAQSPVRPLTQPPPVGHPIPIGKQPELNPAPTVLDSTPNQALANEDLVNEIQAIRKQLGGSIAEQFNGLELGKPGAPMSAQQVFNQELDRLAAQTLQPGGLPPSALAPAGHQPPVSQSNVSRPLKLRSPASDLERTTVRLRQAARQLDEIAADLEDARLFQDADEIREQARRFWSKAREFDSRNN